MTVLLHLLIALVWAIPGGVRGPDVLVGLVVGFLALWLMRPLTDERSYIDKTPLALWLAGYVAWELVLSSLRVAFDVITPAANRQPAIIRIPLDARTDTEIGLFCLLVTVTPGSLVCKLSPDRRTAYVHAMFVDDPEAFRDQLKHDIERRVLELTR